MDEHGDQIEAINVVTEKVDNLSGCRVSQRVLRELRRLPVNNTAHGHSDPHARYEALVHKLVHVEGGEETHAHDSRCSDPRIVLVQRRVVLAEVLQKATEQQGLDDAHDLVEDCDEGQLAVLAPERKDNGLDQAGTLRCTVGQLSLPLPVRNAIEMY